ncbi:hypothetical protein M011DRAFT_466811 [Sporormia fimetaria CBS 119925]|uniref:Uncharacterized protein n=1 Tax=Sporormia fimetaria CBS 119925 TaxID=1340428 RepID=A0A6A6VFA6_9PLEO|nr:hypothetical protein M011DRAFT_466811 [Sporormia fimetaria CBS 119925]
MGSCGRSPRFRCTTLVLAPQTNGASPVCCFASKAGIVRTNSNEPSRMCAGGGWLVSLTRHRLPVPSCGTASSNLRKPYSYNEDACNKLTISSLTLRW